MVLPRHQLDSLKLLSPQKCRCFLIQAVLEQFVEVTTEVLGVIGTQCRFCGASHCGLPFKLGPVRRGCFGARRRRPGQAADSRAAS
jgi:hypothetical protein